MSFKTQTGRRPDLEAIQVNSPEGYIGNRIYPVLSQHEKSGLIYYKTLTADGAAQTGRALGSAPTRTLLADTNTTATCTELIKRYGVAKSEVKNCGGIEAADRLGGMASKRSVLRGLEDLQAAAFLDATSYGAAEDISGGIIDGLITAAKAIKRYHGKLAFVCSTTVYQWMIAQDEIKALLTRSFSNLSAEQVMSLSPEVFRAMLQGIFKFDEVLIGDDDHWSIATQEDAAGVVKLPPPEEFSHKMDPVLGKTALYLPDGDQPFEIESFYNDDDKVNNYDCTSWKDIKEFNSGAKKIVKGMGTPST
jgi:hypothetical protein